MTFLFEGGSATTKEINNTLRNIYNLSFEQEQNCLEEIINGKEISFSNLTNIFKNVKKAEETISGLDNFDYSNQDVEEKKKQVNKNSEYLDLVINELLFRQEKQHNYLQNELRNNQNNLDSLNKLRQRLEKENNLAYNLIDLGEERNIFYSNPDIFYTYHEKRERLDSLDEQVKSLEQRYDNLELCMNPKKEKRNLLQKLKTGFRKSKLVKDCLQEDYFEGLLRIQKLKQNLLPSKEKQIINQEQEDIHSDDYGFNFYAYVLNMTSPRNFRYYRIQDLLEAKQGGNEQERFSKMAQLVRKQKIIGKEDFNYLRTVLFGFEQALKSPSEGFSQEEAKEVCHAIKYSLRRAS